MILQTYFAGFQVVLLAVALHTAAVVTMGFLILNRETEFFYIFSVALVAWLASGHAKGTITRVLDEVDGDADLGVKPFAVSEVADADGGDGGVLSLGQIRAETGGAAPDEPEALS